jgi:MinD-like ATPase involved in chromosome partitioning or flagellar assembly
VRLVHLVRIPVLAAADGAAWEAVLVLGLEAERHGVTVVRRCVDVVDLLAVAISGQARVALISADLRRLDADAVDRLIAADVAPVGVLARGVTAVEDRLRAMGIVHLVTDDADPGVVALVIQEALRDHDKRATGVRATRGFGVTGSSTDAVAPDLAPIRAAAASTDQCRGSVVAVWGPTGAPGRSTVALTLADELARAAHDSLIIDADVYGGVLAQLLGLLDDSPGLAAACRHAGSSKLDTDVLAELCWQVSPTLRVLTGIPRAQRWPELRAAALEAVLATARRLAAFTIVDCGFCLETDEELSFDTMAPRRNGLTLAALDAADVILAVGSADPIGIQRLVRGLSELRDAEVSAPIWVVLNRVRKGVVPGNPEVELASALERFAGRAPVALLPFDQDSLDAALAAGKTLGEAAPASTFRASVIELATELAGPSARPVPHRRRAERTRGVRRSGVRGGPGATR